MAEISPLPNPEKWISLLSKSTQLLRRVFPAVVPRKLCFLSNPEMSLAGLQKFSDDYFNIFKYMGILTFHTLSPFPIQLDFGG